jgi:hypothetical protein
MQTRLHLSKPIQFVVVGDCGRPWFGLCNHRLQTSYAMPPFDFKNVATILDTAHGIAA